MKQTREKKKRVRIFRTNQSAIRIQKVFRGWAVRRRRLLKKKRESLRECPICLDDFPTKDFLAAASVFSKIMFRSKPSSFLAEMEKRGWVATRAELLYAQNFANYQSAGSIPFGSSVQSAPYNIQGVWSPAKHVLMELFTNVAFTSGGRQIATGHAQMQPLITTCAYAFAWSCGHVACPMCTYRHCVETLKRGVSHISCPCSSSSATCSAQLVRSEIARLETICFPKHSLASRHLFENLCGPSSNFVSSLVTKHDKKRETLSNVILNDVLINRPGIVRKIVVLYDESSWKSFDWIRNIVVFSCASFESSKATPSSDKDGDEEVYDMLSPSSLSLSVDNNDLDKAVRVQAISGISHIRKHGKCFMGIFLDVPLRVRPGMRVGVASSGQNVILSIPYGSSLTIDAPTHATHTSSIALFSRQNRRQRTAGAYWVECDSTEVDDDDDSSVATKVASSSKEEEEDTTRGGDAYPESVGVESLLERFDRFDGRVRLQKHRNMRRCFCGWPQICENIDCEKKYSGSMNSCRVRSVLRDYCAARKGRDVTCVRCDAHFCFGCERPIHSGPCRGLVAYAKEKIRDAQLELFSLDTAPCPTCGYRVAKNGGCDHMHCAVCHTDYSWTSARLGFLWRPKRALTASACGIAYAAMAGTAGVWLPVYVVLRTASRTYTQWQTLRNKLKEERKQRTTPVTVPPATKCDEMAAISVELKTSAATTPTLTVASKESETKREEVRSDSVTTLDCRSDRAADQFYPAIVCIGHKKGFKFQVGPRGLGWYVDSVANMEEAVKTVSENSMMTTTSGVASLSDSYISLDTLLAKHRNDEPKIRRCTVGPKIFSPSHFPYGMGIANQGYGEIRAIADSTMKATRDGYVETITLLLFCNETIAPRTKFLHSVPLTIGAFVVDTVSPHGVLSGDSIRRTCVEIRVASIRSHGVRQSPINSANVPLLLTLIPAKPILLREGQHVGLVLGARGERDGAISVAYRQYNLNGTRSQNNAHVWFKNSTGGGLNRYGTYNGGGGTWQLLGSYSSIAYGYTLRGGPPIAKISSSSSSFERAGLSLGSREIARKRLYLLNDFVLPVVPPAWESRSSRGRADTKLDTFDERTYDQFTNALYCLRPSSAEPHLFLRNGILPSHSSVSWKNVGGVVLSTLQSYGDDVTVRRLGFMIFDRMLWQTTLRDESGTLMNSNLPSDFVWRILKAAKGARHACDGKYVSPQHRFLEAQCSILDAIVGKRWVDLNRASRRTNDDFFFPESVDVATFHAAFRANEIVLSCIERHWIRGIPTAYDSDSRGEVELSLLAKDSLKHWRVSTDDQQRIRRGESIDIVDDTPEEEPKTDEEKDRTIDAEDVIRSAYACLSFVEATVETVRRAKAHVVCVEETSTPLGRLRSLNVNAMREKDLRAAVRSLVSQADEPKRAAQEKSLKTTQLILLAHAHFCLDVAFHCLLVIVSRVDELNRRSTTRPSNKTNLFWRSDASRRCWIAAFEKVVSACVDADRALGAVCGTATIRAKLDRWEAILDKTRGCRYFYNHVTGERVLNVPESSSPYLSSFVRNVCGAETLLPTLRKAGNIVVGSLSTEMREATTVSFFGNLLNSTLPTYQHQVQGLLVVNSHRTAPISGLVRSIHVRLHRANAVRGGTRKNAQTLQVVTGFVSKRTSTFYARNNCDCEIVSQDDKILTVRPTRDMGILEGDVLALMFKAGGFPSPSMVCARRDDDVSDEPETPAADMNTGYPSCMFAQIVYTSPGCATPLQDASTNTRFDTNTEAMYSFALETESTTAKTELEFLSWKRHAASMSARRGTAPGKSSSHRREIFGPWAYARALGVSGECDDGRVIAKTRSASSGVE
eukprot:g480.t1